MNKKISASLGAIVIVAAVASLWLVNRSPHHPDQLKLYGNVDIRQVALAFEESGRINTMLVEEGESVRQGQVIATLDTRALHIQQQQAAARLAAQQQTTLKPICNVAQGLAL